VLVVALALRMTVVGLTFDTPLALDPADFSRTGLSIAQGRGYPGTNRAPGGGPSAFRPPAYPALLAGVYAVAGEEAPGAARLVEAVLGTLTVALIGAIGRLLWGRRVGMLALGIAAVAPPLVVMSTALVSESLFVPVVLGAVAAAIMARRSYHHARWAILTGVLIGIAALTRTNGIILLLPLTLAVAGGTALRRKRAWAAPAVVLAAAILAIAPWTIRNWFEFHAFIPVSTEIGYTLAGTYNEASRADHHWPAVWKEAEHGASPEYGEILFNASIHGWNEHAFDDHLTAAAINDITRHPAYVLKVGYWNAIRLFHLGELDLAVANLRDTGVPEIPAWFEILGFYPLALLALGGVATRRARGAPKWLWVVPVCLLPTVFITGFIRFRSPVDPFLVLLAALAVAAGQDRWRRRGQCEAATTINTITTTKIPAAAIPTGR
jgi:4-amino-4-deoxy-L-arabinose transferase-like glycosyltransferase